MSESSGYCETIDWITSVMTTTGSGVTVTGAAMPTAMWTTLTTADLAAAYGRATMAPLGHIDWLIKEPVTIVRDGVTVVAPLAAFGHLTASELVEMPVPHQRAAVSAIIKILLAEGSPAVICDAEKRVWRFAEQA